MAATQVKTKKTTKSKTKATSRRSAPKSRSVKSTRPNTKKRVASQPAPTTKKPKVTSGSPTIKTAEPMESEIVAVDRRLSGERRASDERRERQEEVAVERRQGERRNKVARRRQIDPTTCERDYTQDEIEFMHALDAYKRANGRMFPTCSEILEVIRGLGYERIHTQELPAEGDSVPASDPADSGMLT